MKRILLLLLPLLIFGQATSKHGSSLDFDGAGDYINCGKNVSLNTVDSITIEAWVKSRDYSLTVQNILNKYGLFTGVNYLLELMLDDLRFSFSSGGQVKSVRDETSVLIEGVWYYFVATYDKQNMRLYIDGEETTVQPEDSDMDIVDADLHVGWEEGVLSWLNGTMDEIRIYNRTLGSAEIQRNYRHPSQPYDTSGCVLWFSMNEFTGSSCGDSSSQSNDGTIVDAIWNTDTPVISARFGTYDCNIHFPLEFRNNDPHARNWVGWCWDNEFTKVSELADYYSPNGVPISKFTKQTPEGYLSWLYHSILGWYGDDFDLRLGHGLEVTATEDAVLWLQGFYFPDSVVELDEGDNWVSIPDNTVYVTISDIADDISPTGSAVETFIHITDDGNYSSWLYHSIIGWYGTNWVLEDGEAIKFDCVKDTVWNPIEE